GRIKQGGSTITQQYVKNAFVGRRKNFFRKTKEALVAVKLERRWSKSQILDAYLNTIYFGRGAYGIEAAARAWFGIPAARLSLPQAALLAGIIRAPEALDPSRRNDSAVRRRNQVLDAMLAEGKITREQRDEAAGSAVTALPRRAGVGGRAPHFLEAVRRELIERMGPDAVYRAGLRVRTTLDVDMQRAAEDAVAGVLDRPDDPEAALVAVDPATGSVRAMVGSRDFTKRQLDLATQARRQPGSAFKPFVLAAALEKGLSLGRTYRAPSRISIPTEAGPWSVANYDRRDYGSLGLIEATANSVNTVYAQLIVDAGAANVVDVAHRMGIASKLGAFPSLALGTEEVSPFELAGAYATFAAGGAHARAHVIARVVERGGDERYRFSQKAEQAIDPWVAARVTTALERVMASGTGRRAALGRPAAGKTGTTESHRDAWFAGYTPSLATVVWMGYPDGTRTMERVRGAAVVGGTLPARIWKAFMQEALKNIPAKPFPAPAGTGSAPSGSPSGPGNTAGATILPDATGTGSPPPETTEPSPELSPSPSGSPSPTASS
ncbi:MAG: transglycosylase domain-containing protein, partial [Actinomycetota bacterium]